MAVNCCAQFVPIPELRFCGCCSRHLEQRWACWSSLASRGCSDSTDAGSVLLTLLGSSKSGSRISSVVVAVASSFPDLRSCHQGLFQFVLLVHSSFLPVYRSRQRHRRRRRHCARAPAMGYDSLLRGAAAGLEQEGSGWNTESFSVESPR